MKKSVFENLSKFSRENLRWIIFSIKVAGSANLLKRDSGKGGFL